MRLPSSESFLTAPKKTNFGFSLNDVLHIGPKLQTELPDILLRWRRHRFVFAGDIEKMYRQIRVHEDDWPLQQILWRESLHERIKDFQLCTVTYGLACAPYLALRCLQQLALEADNSHTLAADILRRDTYVDDVLFGASDVPQAREQIRQLNDLLRAGGFRLRKWISNNSEILTHIPQLDQESSTTFRVDDKTTHHTLGIRWERDSDCFLFSPSPLPSDRITKRSILSFISRMFDPLGWLAPIIIVAKIVMQDLWAIRLDRDDELPSELTNRWRNFAQQLEDTTTISIPRWLGTSHPR